MMKGEEYYFFEEEVGSGFVLVDLGVRDCMSLLSFVSMLESLFALFALVTISILFSLVSSSP